MRWRVVLMCAVFGLAAGVAGSGCNLTRPNPLSCADGTCTDPAHPFCDEDGALEGIPLTCVAVACTPAEVAGCRGDLAITCNSAGTNYDLIQCDHGCDVASGGCQLCEPNETACTNGTVATCDASGAVVASQECPLGCFEDEPRCRDIDPSNGLGQFLDMVPEPTDLDLSAGGSIDTSTGVVRNGSSAVLPVASFLVPAPDGGASIRVLVANRVQLGHVAVRASAMPYPALAIVASDEIVISGDLTMWESDPEGNQTFAGSVGFDSCRGGAGDVQTGAQFLRSGSGGGGHATPGGAGGSIDFVLGGGLKGPASGNETLVPLRGGCHGGSSGGGAVQLSSRHSIVLVDGAVINANGHLGVSLAAGPFEMQGGGAGGGILLEAPFVRLGHSAGLLVNGGPAATEAEPVPGVSLTQDISPGGMCVTSGQFHCGNGGNGASVRGPATKGQAVPYSSTADAIAAAGGGGGLGFIRINTRDGSYEKSSDTIESGALSTGSIATR